MLNVADEQGNNNRTEKFCRNVADAEMEKVFIVAPTEYEGQCGHTTNIFIQTLSKIEFAQVQKCPSLRKRTR